MYLSLTTIIVPGLIARNTVRNRINGEPLLTYPEIYYIRKTMMKKLPPLFAEALVGSVKSIVLKCAELGLRCANPPCAYSSTKELRIQ